jgi:flavin-binding protein dodecin
LRISSAAHFISCIPFVSKVDSIDVIAIENRKGESVMSDHVYKIVEIVGSSKLGTDDAIRNAIETSAKSIRHISWFEVVKTTGHVVDDKVAHFQVTLKVGFRIEGD